MTGGGSSILVVDDEPESLGLLTGILAEEGYHVRPADSGELALASVAAEAPELILLDIRMPGMGGLEVCRRLKESEAHREIPLMFISASAELEEQVEGLVLGAVDFVSKPFRREELLARVRTHLELGRLRAQLEEQVAQRTAELGAAVEQLRFEVAERQSTEMALRKSEERFRAIFSQAAVGIAISGPDTKWLLLNDRFCGILGYSQAELSGKTFLDITHADDSEASLTAVSQLLAGEIPAWSTEKRYVRKDGVTVWARLFLSLVRDQHNQPKYVVSVVEDITEKMQAERALRDAEHRLALAQRAAHLGVWHRNLGTHVITIGGEYARLCGLAPDRTTLTHEEWLSVIHPDDRERVQALIREARERTHIFDAEYRVVWPDGSTHWILAKGTVFLDDSGRPIRTTGVTMDITERKRAEAALRESEERFRNMADTAPVMIWVSGPDKLCTFFNKVWLEFTGRTMEQEVGNGWIDCVHPDDVAHCFETYATAFDARRAFQMEYRIRRADGEYRWVLDDGVPRFTSDGIFAGYIGSCSDITEVKRGQEGALASQKLECLGQLARGIAHDFNNLLGGILASTELALAERAEGSPSEEELLRIRTAAIRGGEIVRQLMTYGGEESAGQEPIDLSHLVDEMLQLLRVSISKRATLKPQLGEGLPAVQANPAQIRQVVMNLVTNASEAIGEEWNGVICVTTARVSVGPGARITDAANLRAGDYIKLVVSDTGSGMTPEVQSRIFDPFFTTKSTGRGLGLAAVQGIVRSHNGSINVVSSLGHGTRVEVLLPCTTELALAVRYIAAPFSAGALGSVTGTALVVEDEDSLRLAVSKMLRRAGISVIEATDGNVAVDLFRANVQDIAAVLLDMTLPGMSGPEVFVELRRIRPDVKIILTSAYGQEWARSAVGGQQTWNFIRKPYQLNDVVKLIRDSCLQKGATSPGHSSCQA